MLKRSAITLALLGATALAAAPAAAAQLVVATADIQDYVDPGKDHSNVGSQQYYNAFDPLIEKDYSAATPRFRPGLATAWTQTSPRTIEFTIRKGVMFHNGDALTADDVVFSLQRILEDATPEYLTIRKQFFENWEKVEKVDEDTVRITARRPEPLFETLLNVQPSMIVPKAYIMGLTGDPEAAEPSDYDAFGLKPVGTGPYKIVSFTPGQQLIYERFDDFWGEPAPFDRVELRTIPELSTRITALKNGEVDLITNVPPDQLDVISGDPSLKVEGAVTPLFHVVFYNTNNPKLADKRIRQALNQAVDRDMLNEALWLGHAVVPSTHTFPQYGELYMPELETFAYDPEKAKQLLAEAGYDGSPIRYDTQSVYYTNGLLAAQAIQEMWAAVGVPMEINVVERWTGNDPDMEARNWSNPMYFADPAGSFGTMWSPTGARITAGSWTPSADYTALWERFRYSTDLDERRQAYAEIMDYVEEEAPFLVLYQPYESYGMRRDIDWKPRPGHIPYVLDFRAGSISVAASN